MTVSQLKTIRFLRNYAKNTETMSGSTWDPAIYTKKKEKSALEKKPSVLKPVGQSGEIRYGGVF